MKITEIKRRMETLMKKYVEEKDESYFELYDSLHTLASLDLISYETWKKIVDYDRKLYAEYELIY